MKRYDTNFSFKKICFNRYRVVIYNGCVTSVFPVTVDPDLGRIIFFLSISLFFFLLLKCLLISWNENASYSSYYSLMLTHEDSNFVKICIFKIKFNASKNLERLWTYVEVNLLIVFWFDTLKKTWLPHQTLSIHCIKLLIIL